MPGADVDARVANRDPHGRGHRDDAERRAEAEQQRDRRVPDGRVEIEVPVDDVGQQHQRRDDDQVVEDGCKGRSREPAPSVQQRNAERGQAVEGDLGKEEAGERGGLLADRVRLALPAAQRVQVHDEGRREHRHDGEGEKHSDDHADDRIGGRSSSRSRWLTNTGTSVAVSTPPSTSS